MFRKFLQRLLGLFFIFQTVFLFVQEHMTSLAILDKILVLEALIFLLIFPWILKISKLAALTFAIIGTCMILNAHHFSFMKSYYPYIVFFPALIGILIVAISYTGKNAKPKS